MPTLNELGGKLKAKYPGSYDHLTDLEAGRRLRAKYPDAYLNYAGADTNRVTIRSHERGRPKGKSLYTKATDLIPTVTGGLGGGLGSAVGAVVGIPGGPAGIAAGRRIGGAAGANVFGAGGEAVRQLATEIPALVSGGVPAYEALGAPKSPAEAFKKIADVGAEQAVYDVTGRGAAKVLRGAGKVTTGMALAGRKFMPEAVVAALSEGIAFTKGGLEKIEGKLAEGGKKIRHMLAQNQHTFDIVDIVKGGGQKLVDEIKNNQTGLAAGRWNQYQKFAQDLINRHTPEGGGGAKALTSHTLQMLKTDADKIADPIFKRIGSRLPPSPEENALATFYKAMGDHARDLLEKTTPDFVDRATGKTITLSAMNKLQQGRIYLQRILAGEKGKTPLGQTVLRTATGALPRTVTGAIAGEEAGRRHITPGGPLVGAAGGALLGNQATSSVVGLILHSPALLAAVKQSPRIFGALLKASQSVPSPGGLKIRGEETTPPQTTFTPEAPAQATPSREDTLAIINDFYDQPAAIEEITTSGKGFHPTPRKETVGERSRRLYGER